MKNNPSHTNSGSIQDHGLSNNLQLLKTTIDSSLDMIQVFEAVRNEEGTIIDFIWVLNNEASVRIYGDVIGKSLLTLQPGVVEEGIFDAFKQVAESGKPQQYEKHYVHEQFDGWYYQSVVKMGDGVATTTADITARKKVESDLHLAKNSLHATLDSSPYVIQAFEAVRNEEGTIVDFTWIFTNHSWNKLYGDVIGKSLLQQSPGVVETGLFEKFIQVTETGISIDHEQYYSHEQFHDQWFHQTLVKMDDGFVMHVEDITERKRAEAEILRLKDQIAQKATDKYKALFESIDEGFAIQEVVTDDNGNVTDVIYREVNGVFGHHTGMKDAPGKKVSEFVPHIEQSFLDALTQVYKTGSPLRNEGYSADLGRWFTYHYSRIGGAGSPLIAVVFNDITERKQREQQQQFLIKFSDALRAEPNAEDIANRALQMLAEQLQLDRCYVGIALLDDNRGIFPYQYGNEQVPPMPEEGVRLTDFPEALRKTFDETLVITDFQNIEGLTVSEKQNFAALGFGALVVANVRKEMTNPDWSINAVSASSRCWTQVEIQLIEDVTERTWAAIERAKTEGALRKSEEKYRTLFNSIDEGFCIIEVVFDEQDKPVDYRFLEANHMFVKQTGLKNAVGKTMKELAPQHESFWFEVYGEIAKTGEPKRFEHAASQLAGGVWFDVYAFRTGTPEKRRVAILFNDITDRKHREQQQEYLILLNDTLRPLIDPIIIQRKAMEFLGAHLKVDRVVYADINIEEDYFEVNDNYTKGDVQKIFGRFPFSAFGSSVEMLKRGETLIIDDVNVAVPDDDEKAQFLAIEVQAVVAVPLVKGGKLVVDLSIHQSTPRHWRPDEIALIQETAERTWAAVERAKAEETLRKAQELYRIQLEQQVRDRTLELLANRDELEREQHFLEQVTDKAPLLIYVYDLKEERFTYINKRVEELIGKSEEYIYAMGPHLFQAILHPEDLNHYVAYMSGLKNLSGDQVTENDFRVWNGSQFRWFRSRDSVFQEEKKHVLQVIGIAEDVTYEKMLEEKLQSKGPIGLN